jgi:2,5-diamino-6-(ribosylamino)-4(3H)-pyrimidinone 5'-phosphate reductase
VILADYSMVHISGLDRPIHISNMEYDFPAEHHAILEPYLPPPANRPSDLPHVLLTYAQSLDGRIAAAPGQRTPISGPRSLAMTHFLRARCDAVLVGAGTAAADDPGLNCRLRPRSGRRRQPTAVVVDPRGRWGFAAGSRMMRLARDEAAARRREEEGDGGGAPARRPTVVLVVDAPERVPPPGRALLADVGGRVLVVPRGDGGDPAPRMPWEDVFRALKGEGIGSVMVEGGADVARSLLAPANRGLLGGVIVTVAPVWLGEGGVAVAPLGEDADVVLRLKGVRWLMLGEDVVVCGHP